MGHRIGIDVGGTFTDLFAALAGGHFQTAKVASTPGDESQAVLSGVEAVAASESASLDDFLGATDEVILGTTVATNAMLEQNGAAVGMLTTGGFRDLVEMRRNHKESVTDLALSAPFAIAPRRRRLGVTERIDYAGRVVVPLDEEEAHHQAIRLREQGVDSVAICFLWSFANPAHELRVAEIVREEVPGAYVVMSHQILPNIREFERFATTLVSAFVGPRLAAYLQRLKTGLREHNFGGELLVMLSNGGMMPVAFAERASVETVLSGPSGGVVAGAALGALSGYPNVITVDMGGTSYDVCLITDARPELSRNYWINRQRVALPMVDVNTIGAGGGSVAWVDPGGALRVGPRSAGAVPGPACYDRGGTEPTVTDADLVLGYLNPDYFLGGQMELRRDLAEEAIRSRIAEPLGINLTAAASAIFKLVNHTMTNAIRRVSVSRGRDPREYCLLAFGGAGAIHAGAQAGDLGVRTILVPRQASVLSALGTLIADFKLTRVQGFHTRSQEPDLDGISRVLSRLENEARAHIGRQDSLVSVEIQRFMDMRYPRQVHEAVIPVAASTDGRVTSADFDDALVQFAHEHRRLYGYALPERPVEVINLRLEAVGRRLPIDLGRGELGEEDADAAVKAVRKVHFESAAGYVDTPIFAGELLKPGNLVHGPALVEEPDTTVVVYPGYRLLLDERLTYRLEWEGEEGVAIP